MNPALDDTPGLLIKPVSADCNMACRYCFYMRPGDPYRLEGRHLMDDSTLGAMISGYMKSASGAASFGWQGGEPLLAGLDFFERVVALQQLWGRSAQLVSNNLQTNGLLLDDGWAKFFRRYNFFIGVSLDGPEQYHNHYRCFANPGGGFQQTMNGIRFLQNRGVDFSILAVVSDVTVRKPSEIFDFFIKNGLTRLQFIPSVDIDAGSGELQPYSVGVEDYRDFLCTLFDLWYGRGNPTVSIRLFENVLALYSGREPEICAFKNRCGDYVVVEYNGDLYPCDFFVEEPWLIGNLRETSLPDLQKKRKRREFNNRKMVQSSGCKTCEWNFICHFGCQHYRTAAGENYLCAAYREFFRYTAQRFSALARKLGNSRSE